MLTLGPLAFGVPWGLAALLAIPTILAIHLFRRRSPPRRVTGLFLWPPPAPSTASGRRRERIVNHPSLWLELLAALALTWWLADVHLAGDDQGRHLVIVLDSRLSLSALLPAGDTPAERIRSALNEQLAQLTSRDRVSVIASGISPRLLAGPATTAEAATTALVTWQADAGWHELMPALTLATQLAGASGDVLLASDRIPPVLPENIGVITRGEALPTSGIADARWLRDARGERLAIRFSGSAPARLLTVRSGDRVLTTVMPASGEATTIIELSAPPDQLELSLGGADPLPFDDAVILHRPPLRVVKVAVDLPPASKALIDKALAALPDLAPGGVAPDLVISAGDPPETGTWHLQLRTGTSTHAALGPFLIRQGHPLGQDLDATGLLWSGGSLDVTDGSTALISAGPQILLSERRRGRDRLLQLHADLGRGTLTQHSLWPALFANLIAARRAALPGVSRPDVPCGRPLAVVLPPGHEVVNLIAPDLISTTLAADADGSVLLPPLTQAGTWQLTVEGKPWQELHALNLDPRLADLSPATTSDQVRNTGALTAVARRRSPIEQLLPLLVVGAAAIGAWLCFRRGH